MAESRRMPATTLGVALAATVLATGNLSGIGIGDGPLLYDTDALPRLVAAAVLVCAVWVTFFVLQRSDSDYSLRVDVAWGLLAALAAWSAVSAAVSPHRLHAILGQSERLEGVVTLAVLALAYGGALQVVRSISDVRRVVAPLVVAATLLAAYGLAQFAGFEPTNRSIAELGFEARSAFATFGNPNFLAALLVLAMPAALGLAAESPNTAGRVAWSIAAAVLGGALVVTFTRSAWVAAIVEAVVLVALVSRTSRPSARALRAGLGASTAVIAVLVAIAWTSGSGASVSARFADLAATSGSASERIELARTALSATADKPLLGEGPDAFLAAFRKHRTEAYVMRSGPDQTLNNAHSWPMQFAATTGLPGALLLVAAVVLGLARGRGALSRNSLDVRGGMLMAAVWAGCLGFATCMLANVGVVGATVPFVVMLAVTAAPHSGGVQLPKALRAGALAASVVVAAAAVAGGATLLVADASYLEARTAYHDGDYDASLALAEKASALNPTSVKYARGAAQAASAITRGLMVEGAGEEAGSDTTAQAGAVRASFETADVLYERLLDSHPADYAGLAWAAALRAEVAAYLADDEIAASARDAAKSAARFDRQHSAVAALAAGGLDPADWARAAAVPALP